MDLVWWAQQVKLHLTLSVSLNSASGLRRETQTILSSATSTCSSGRILITVPTPWFQPRDNLSNVSWLCPGVSSHMDMPRTPFCFCLDQWISSEPIQSTLWSLLTCFSKGRIVENTSLKWKNVKRHFQTPDVLSIETFLGKSEIETLFSMFTLPEMTQGHITSSLCLCLKPPLPPYIAHYSVYNKALTYPKMLSISGVIKG